MLGYVSFLIDGEVRIDGVAVRRTAKGALALSFPERPTKGGPRPIIRPISDAARRNVEAQVFRELGLEEGATP